MIDKATRLLLFEDLRIVYEALDKMGKMVEIAVVKKPEEYKPHLDAYTLACLAVPKLHTRLDDLVYLSDVINKLEKERDDLKEELSYKEHRINTLVKQLKDSI